MEPSVGELIQTDQLPDPANPVSTAPALMQVIANAATNPNCDLDRMDRLFAMYRTMELRQEERLFDSAMSDAQAEMTAISVDANNAQTRSKYATYYALDKMARPIYSKYGFALSFRTGEAVTNDSVMVICRVSNKRGFSRDYSISMPADGKGAKGGDVMTRTHATKSAVTYGMSTLLVMIFNLAINHDPSDDDGIRATSAGEVVTQEQAEELLSRAGAAAPRLAKAFNVESLLKLPASRYKEAIRRLDEAAKLSAARRGSNANP